MFLVDALYLLQAAYLFCSISTKASSTFNLIFGEGEYKAHPLTMFHKCSMDVSCTHVILFKGTSVYKAVNDSRYLKNLPRNALIWERKTDNQKQQEAMPMKTTCKTLKENGGKSGLYNISLPSGVHLVYCEMDVNGGGYTFLSNNSVPKISQSDIDFLFTDKRDVLLRILQQRGSQSFTVIQQYNDTGGLSVQYSSYQDYTRPKNHAVGKYIFLGILPAAQARNKNRQGFISNGSPVTFVNCDRNPNNYFAFFSKEYNPISISRASGGVSSSWKKTANHGNPEKKLPNAFFLFTEMHFGGCGVYSENAVSGTAIGIR